VTWITTAISGSDVPEELRLYLAILLELALAFESGETGRETWREYLRETLIPIRPVLRKSSRLWIT
jgi:hypothetical protein